MPSSERHRISPITDELHGSHCHKLRCLLDLCQKKLKEYGITNPGIFRFRGDTLEISIRPSKEDVTAYVKVGVCIAFLKRLIQHHGFLSIVNLFPKFDEPELVAFIHLTDVRSKPKTTLRSKVNVANGTSVFLSKIIQSSNARNLMLALNGQQDVWYNKKLHDYFGIKSTDLEATYSIPAKIKIGHSRNMPTIWLQVGDFVGEILFDSMHELIDIPLKITIASEQIKKPDSDIQNPASIMQFACINVG